jgi:hypothetical protein
MRYPIHFLTFMLAKDHAYTTGIHMALNPFSDLINFVVF